jgi:transaldolase
VKFFVDSADIKEIRNAIDLGVCDGVTTNPSLVARTGKPFAQVIREITEVVDGPISLEATSLDTEGMLREARELAAMSPNVVVKVPMTENGMRAVRTLAREGIHCNVTLVFSAAQALLAAKAGASYVSPFVGRLDDVAFDGMQLITSIMDIYGNYDFGTQIIVASVRDPIHVVQAAEFGADIATVPFPVLEKLFKHPLTDIGIKKFMDDWAKVPR